MRRKWTGFWQPRRPLGGHGYIAGEHATKVRRAERAVEDVLREHLPRLAGRDLSHELIRQEARMMLRMARTYSRAGLWLRTRVHAFAVNADPDQVAQARRALYGALVSARLTLETAPWNSGPRRCRRFSRLHGCISGLHRLAWVATRPPWPAP